MPVAASVFCLCKVAAQIPIGTVRRVLRITLVSRFRLRSATPKHEFYLCFCLSIYIISYIFFLCFRVLGIKFLTLVHTPLGCGLDFGIKIRCSLYLRTGIVRSFELFLSCRSPRMSFLPLLFSGVVSLIPSQNHIPFGRSLNCQGSFGFCPSISSRRNERKYQRFLKVSLYSFIADFFWDSAKYFSTIQKIAKQKSRYTNAYRLKP